MNAHTVPHKSFQRQNDLIRYLAKTISIFKPCTYCSYEIGIYLLFRAHEARKEMKKLNKASSKTSKKTPAQSRKGQKGKKGRKR